MPIETASVEEPNKIEGIYKALLGVMGEIGAISKDRYNEGQRYYFRGIDEVYNTLNPLMVKYGVFCLPHVTEVQREERQSKSGGVLIYTVAHVDYEFYAADGSSVTSHLIGEGMDSGDKSMNKALSAAHKYALLQMFCIPTEEPTDADLDSPELGGKPKKAVKQTPQPEPAAPRAPEAAPDEARNCPDCGKPLKLRKRKDSTEQFYGCSGYPACRYTAPLSDTEAPAPVERNYKNYYRLLKEYDISSAECDTWLKATYAVKSKNEIADDRWTAFMAVLENDPGKVVDAIAKWRGPPPQGEPLAFESLEE